MVKAGEGGPMREPALRACTQGRWECRTHQNLENHSKSKFRVEPRSAALNAGLGGRGGRGKENAPNQCRAPAGFSLSM